MSRIFDRQGGAQYDYVFNCGGETRYSQEDEVYRARSLELSLALGREAARRKIRCFVECSTGQVYKPDSSPSKETDKTKPWTKIAKWKLKAEEDLAKIDGLNLVVLRLANVYGPYTKGDLSTLLCMARVYQELGEKMKWLWDKGLRKNTVHVDDVSRALWTAATWYSTKGSAAASKPPVFNVVDHGQTSACNLHLLCQSQQRTNVTFTCAGQGIMADLIQKAFNIESDFQGTIINSFARLNLDSVIDDVNEDTLDPWAELQSKAGIQPGPISPFMEPEILKDTDLSMDGSKFEKETGFTYKHERLDEKEVADTVDSFKRMGWWP